MKLKHIDPKLTISQAPVTEEQLKGREEKGKWKGMAEEWLKRCILGLDRMPKWTQEGEGNFKRGTERIGGFLE